jgi:hypothetical protein
MDMHSFNPFINVIIADWVHVQLQRTTVFIPSDHDIMMAIPDVADDTKRNDTASSRLARLEGF